MANKALSIMKLRTLIRFKQEGRKHQFIGQTLGLSRTTVVKYVQYLEGSGLDWAALSSLDDHSLLTLCRSGHTDKADDRWAILCQLLPHYERELKRPHVTRQTLLEEYKHAYPEGYGKTQFFQYLSEHLRLGQAYQPIEHKAGEKLFVDYAGDHMYLTDRDTGEQTKVEVFVAALGCSGLIYAEASMGQTLAEFCLSVCHAFEYIGGVFVRTPGAPVSAATSGRTLYLETTARTDGAKKLSCSIERYQALLQRPVPKYWPQGQGLV